MKQLNREGIPVVRCTVVRLIQEMGMRASTCCSTPMNFHYEAMWREMEALVESGMSEMHVISAATKTNAEILGNLQLIGGKRNTGTIEPGMRADVIVIDGDPLANISVLDQVQITIAAGRVWYSDQWNAPADVRRIGTSLQPTQSLTDAG